MIIGRSRRFTVSMGNYETYSFGAEVSMSHEDCGLDIDDPYIAKKLTEAVLDELDRQLLEEVQEVALSADKKSFLKKAMLGAKETSSARKASSRQEKRPQKKVQGRRSSQRPRQRRVPG